MEQSLTKQVVNQQLTKCQLQTVKNSVIDTIGQKSPTIVQHFTHVIDVNVSQIYRTYLKPKLKVALKHVKA